MTPRSELNRTVSDTTRPSEESSDPTSPAPGGAPADDAGSSVDTVPDDVDDADHGMGAGPNGVGGDGALGTRGAGFRDRILERLAVLAEDRADVAVAFARAALRRVPVRQLAAADTEATAAQLLDAFRFADRGTGRDAGIRVFTPDVSLDGWSDAGTVVEVHSDDRPFLLSTIVEELQHRGLVVVRSLHPVLGVERDDAGRLASIVPARDATLRESFVHVELETELDSAAARDLDATLQRHLRDLYAATDDYPDMRDRVRDEAARLRAQADAHPDPGEATEAADLLEWLLDENLVLLGTREYEIVDLPDDHPAAPGRATRALPGSGTGILRDVTSSSLAELAPISELPDEQRRRYLHGSMVTISRTNRLSTVHRRARMEYVGIKRYDEDGEVTGEFRLLGLFTRKGYAEPSQSTPLLRRKLQRILELEDVVEGSHDEATIVSLFQALPKDELFQASVETLHATIVGLLHAEEHSETTVSTRVDRFTRTVSVVVAVPRDRYGPDLRKDITRLLLARYGGTGVDVDLSLGDRPEALARFWVHVPTSDIPDVPADVLQREIRRLTRTWLDEVSDALVRHRGQAEGARLVRTVASRLPRGYRDAIAVPRAVHDVLGLDRLLRSTDDLHVHLHPDPEDHNGARLVVVRRGVSLELSSFLPILESIGLVVVEEVPHDLEGDGPALFLHDFGVRDTRGQPIDVTAEGDRLADSILAAWKGWLEIDSLNRLVLYAGLSWRQVNLLRAYRRYRRQVGTAYTTTYINDTLAAHPQVVHALVDLFEARFEPRAGTTDEEIEELRQRVIEGCDAVERLDHDRILRSFLALIDATLRTNAFRADAEAERPDGPPVPYLAFKLDSSRLPDIPKPVPYREIFVYSPLLEGIHLRGGPVARGGIRWSDRQDDVRTEVLGLMKAQVLKNAVIVPTGAKGGFVLKRRPSDRAALAAEVERQYVTFIRALLDVTDNIEGGHVITPRHVRRRDGDDPYLVVAADKGTATFSDTANAVAERYGFWLGDAFASGGSNGYDHKALGITARGAWVAIQRHFRELGVDTQSDPISVVGIGDMSGDVFGNGMLSSRSIRLIAAFDHRDVFLDPDPDPEAAFEERQRLFRTPGSTWQDYDRGVLSPGGGVFSRDAKRIELSDEIRAALRIEDEALAPNELIRAVLRAPVDLLFAGGIGTYVKASTQSNDDIGDRTNDDVRVDANEVRARVYGEGANLSITQQGRIQYARRGGRINQDAIDNAGGVACSDREVNVKILLNLAMEDGRLDRGERDALLVEVTEEVVAQVLHDVDLQTFRLSQEAADSPRLMDTYEQLMVSLESTAGLDRAVEALPTTEQMHERAEAGAGLTRPELATLLGHVKRRLATEVAGSSLPDQPSLQATLEAYFPPTLVRRFGDLLGRHRLRTELVAMVVANDVIDRMGITFPFRLQQETGADATDVLAAYWVARETTQVADRWRGIDRLGHLLGPERQLELKREVDRMIGQLTRRYLQDPLLPDVGRVVTREGPVFDTLVAGMMDLGTSTQRNHRRERAQRLTDDLVEDDLAAFLACTRDLAMVPDVSAVARALGREDDRAPAAIADTFLRLSSALAVDRLQRVLGRIEPHDRWARWQHGGLLADLRRVWADAVRHTLTEEPSLPEPEAVERFLQRRAAALEHAIALVRDVEAADPLRLDGVAVAVRALRQALEAA